MENIDFKNKKKPLYKKWWFWIIAVFLLFGLGSLLDQPETAPSNSQTASQKSVFDVPSLFGKNIDETRVTLGKPNDKQLDLTAQQMELGATEWSNEWAQGGYTLTVTFDSKTRAVKDFFISSTTSAEDKDPYLLLPVGNLSKTDSKYTIKPVKQLKNPSLYTGIIITPH